MIIFYVSLSSRFLCVMILHGLKQLYYLTIAEIMHTTFL